jgi:hypothetical protein
MSSELLYTSAPQGLKGGSRGFTTVLCTAGMPPNLADKLESFSGYKHVYSPQDPLAEHNPVRYAYLRPNVGGRTVTVISRLAAYGVDYSGRSNKIAHHVVLEANERPEGGPAWLLSQNDLWKSSWNGECKTLPTGPRIPEGGKLPSVCRQWLEVTGDAGWGGQMVAWLKQSNKPVWLIYEPKQQGKLLDLLVESLSLLPDTERWKYTFATYFSGLPSDVDCRIRGVVVGSDEARLASARGYLIDLTCRAPLSATSAWIEAARTGIVSSTPAAVPAIFDQPLDPVPVLGTREAPSVAEFISVESPWLDEPQRVSEPSLPADLPLGLGDYQLAPPPMPAARRTTKPPAIPSQGDSVGSNSVSFRWALPAVATVVLLLTLGVGFWVFRDTVASSLSSPKTSLGVSHEMHSGSEMESKPEVNVVEEKADAGSEEISSDTISATPEIPSESSLPEISLILKNGEKESVQNWSQNEDTTFEISAYENREGVTGYKLNIPGDLKANIEPHDSFLAINGEGMIVVNKRQDFEASDWGSNPKKLEIAIKGDESEIRISLKVQLENEKRKVLAKEISLPLDIDRSEDARELPIDVWREYENELDEVEGFRFELTSDGIAYSEVEGKFGRIARVGEMLVYTVDVAKVTSGNQLNSVEIFDYQVSCDDGGPASREKIRIDIHNPFRFDWLAAKTVNGSDLRFEREVIRGLFKTKGEYEVFFKQGNVLIGQVVVLEMIEEGGKVLLAGNKNLSAKGVGKFTFDPSSKDKNKIEFSGSSIVKRHIESLCIESFLFQSVCEEQINDELMRKKKEIEDLEASAKNERNPGLKKQQDGDLERLRNDRKSVESLRNRVTDLLKNRKGIRDARSLEDLLNANAEVLVSKFIDEMEAKNSCAKIVLEQCKKEALSRFKQSRDYIRSCELIVVKKGVGSAAAEEAMLQSKDIPAPPIP